MSPRGRGKSEVGGSSKTPRTRRGLRNNSYSTSSSHIQTSFCTSPWSKALASPLTAAGDPSAVHSTFTYQKSTAFTTRARSSGSLPIANTVGCAARDAVDAELSQEDSSSSVSSILTFRVPGLKRRAKRGSLTPLRRMGADCDESPKHPLFPPRNSRNQLRRMSGSPRPCTPPSSPEDVGLADLPDDIGRIYQETRKIKKLYDWQKRCLSDKHLLEGSNLLISLPTGAGKTLIAEVLMLRETIVKKRNALLILPYVAIVQEKIHSLSIFDDFFHIWIEEYAASKGRLPPIKRRNNHSIYVATIEKANMLINSLIEENRIHELGLVIVDELHMLGEGTRGATLEQVIVKFIQKGNGQIVGMSATLANLGEVASFFRASIFSTDFRPVKLVERAKINNTLFRVDSSGKLIPEVDLGENKLKSRDPDGLVQLLSDIIPKKSAIIFCPTKQSCENICRMITRLAPKNLRERKRDERRAAVAALRDEEDGRLCSDLERGICCGVAFHHSGLTAGERRAIETAFQDGVISILCSTSTLAAGVNMPARRVIIKAPLVGREPLGKAQYMQMIGRAGRAGFDEEGDAVTIVHPGSEEIEFRKMLTNPLLECRSSLGEPQMLSSFLLDVISLKIAARMEEFREVFAKTLFGMQNEDAMDRVKQGLEELQLRRLAHINADGYFITTLLGRAAYSANIPPIAAQTISDFLTENLCRGIVLSSHFHLIFTIVPFDIYTDVDWNVFYDEYTAMPKSEQRFLATLGLHERNLVKCFVDRPKLKEGEPALRLYIAFMMQRVWNQESFWSVSERFSVTRGWLQSALQSTCAQASCITRFSEKIPSLWPLKHLLPDLVQRLRECSQQELIPLLSIDGVRTARARQLYDKGFKTVGAVAAADPSALVACLEHLNRKQASLIVRSAQTLIRDQLAERIEEVETMGATSRDFLAELMKNF